MVLGCGGGIGRAEDGGWETREKSERLSGGLVACFSVGIRDDELSSSVDYFSCQRAAWIVKAINSFCTVSFPKSTLTCIDLHQAGSGSERGLPGSVLPKLYRFIPIFFCNPVLT